MKRVAITQSNYIPWRGYFDLIASVDEFILYDDMQYTRRDWRNRNKIKTGQGTCWLTIPVEVKGKYFQKLKIPKYQIEIGIKHTGKRFHKAINEQGIMLRSPLGLSLCTWPKIRTCCQI